MTTPPWQQRITDILSKPAPLIVIIGPTASGKTSFSLEVAAWLQAQGRHPEVINADSRQLYRGLDIGTAKIRDDEMQGIPHHLLSVLDPTEEVTMKWYQDACHDVIRDVHVRKSIPLLVGGSMLYVSAIVDGLTPTAPGNAAMRLVLSNLYDQDDGIALHARLTDIDPESAAAIPRENKHYVIRALEIYGLTGMKKSASLTTTECPYTVTMLGITKPREELYNRINTRVDVMFDQGFIKEVEALLAKGYDDTAPAMQSHGYREIMDWIANGENPDELAELKKKIAQASRNYAKRQMTWWKRDERILWIES